VTRVS